MLTLDELVSPLVGFSHCGKRGGWHSPSTVPCCRPLRRTARLMLQRAGTTLPSASLRRVGESRSSSTAGSMYDSRCHLAVDPASSSHRWPTYRRQSAGPAAPVSKRRPHAGCPAACGTDRPESGHPTETLLEPDPRQARSSSAPVEHNAVYPSQ